MSLKKESTFFFFLIKKNGNAVLGELKDAVFFCLLLELYHLGDLRRVEGWNGGDILGSVIQTIGYWYQMTRTFEFLQIWSINHPQWGSLCQFSG